MSLDKYLKKRNFRSTPEPGGDVKGWIHPFGYQRPTQVGNDRGQIFKKRHNQLTFVVQKHSASHLHFDLRLEKNGVLKSWAVPKGPSMDPSEKRLAIEVEDHPLEYGKFHGRIPEGNYGAGTVEIWDHGTYSTKFADEKMWEFYLRGKKLKGMFALIKLTNKKGSKYLKGGNNWLLIKKREDEEPVAEKTKKESLIKNKIDMPHKVKPMLATLVEKAFDKEGWTFEIKWDGYRAIAEVEKGKVKLYSRNLQSFETSFPEIFEALGGMPYDMVLDGEIVALDENGKPSFQLLQNYQKDKKGELVYYVFDILFLNGRNLQGESLKERRKQLEKIIPKKGKIALSEVIETQGKKFFRAAKAQGLEGIVAKKESSPYQQGVRGRDWLKIKTHMRQEAIICGYTKARGEREKFGSLVLGVYKGKILKYIGHTGTGFDQKSLEFLYGKLKPLIRKKSPFETPPKTNMPVTWVKPELICEVKFAEWTQDELMRQSVFLGLREDKVPEEVEIEKFGGATEVVIGKQKLVLSNLDKIFWPVEGYTKGDLIEYYRNISPILLPYLKDRPESLLRYPDGIDGINFYHKDLDIAPRWIKKFITKTQEENKKIHYLLCQDEATLVYMINLGCIDINPWNSRIGHLNYPDYMILDLDPEEVGFEKVIETALVVHEVLEEAGIPNYPKTSGASGMHIYSPLGAAYSYDQVRDIAQIIAIKVHERLPKITSLERHPIDRKGKVYLDCFQNARGQTLATPYSVRAKPGATVSTPLEWKEVNEKLMPQLFRMENILERIKKKGDLFRPVLGKGFDMKKALKKM